MLNSCAGEVAPDAAALQASALRKVRLAGLAGELVKQGAGQLGRHRAFAPLVAAVAGDHVGAAFPQGRPCRNPDRLGDGRIGRVEFQAEPELALAGGLDGMDFVRQLLSDLTPRMNPEAILVLEIGNEREHFENAFPTLEAVWLETSAGEDQVLLLTREALLKFKS